MTSHRTITINGRTCSLDGVASRTMLGDFLRDRLDLTGTHLGCEHGICGACTVSIDGHAARSCITLAHACSGADVTTIEGFEDDICMAQLREAFSAEHALQCGYCTPGMLVAARDLILRHPDADEATIRIEMSGNLCRCTGYMGIVHAIQRVIAQRKADPASTTELRKAPLGPVGAHSPAVRGDSQTTQHAVAAAGSPAAQNGSASPSPGAPASLPASAGPLIDLEEHFTVDFPPDQVWAFFGRLEEVATCLPGLSLTSPPQQQTLQIALRVRAGPITAEFEGSALVQQDHAAMSGRIIGNARDKRSGTAAQGDVRYRLSPVESGQSTRVDIVLGYALAGPLAQFSRGAIARDIARKLTEAFGENLRQRLTGGTAADTRPAELNAGSVVWSVLISRLRSALARIFGLGR